jgi:arylsulfatase A-like enzyme
MTLAALALAALAGAAILRWVTRRTRFFGNKALVAAALVLVVALPIVAHVAETRVGSSMPVRTVVRDLVVDTSAWTVEISDPASPPHAGTITPALDFRADVGERPSLVMSPPCRVSFTTRAEDGGVKLFGAAGCGLETAHEFEDRADAPRLVFRVTVDGKEVFEHHREPWRQEPVAEREWKHFGGGDGIALEPGTKVTLSVDVERGNVSAPLLAGFGGLALVRTGARERTRATSAHPNIILIVVDTLRADRTSAYGYARPTTPALERLASRGILYESAYSTSSWTWPSTASILTGLEPAEHGVVSDLTCYLSEELTTLAEALQEQGWTTAAFSGNPLVAPNKNFGQGFETFDVAPSTFSTSDRIVPDALKWLEAHAAVRFFLYLHLVDPHEIHRVPEEQRARFAGDPPADLDEHAMTKYAERLLANEGRTTRDGTGQVTFDPTRVVPPEHARWLSAGYDAAVATADHWLEILLERLDELDLAEDTLLVFTSDHGEELLDHGHLKHGQSVYAELVQVPLVLAGPGVAKGVRVRTPVSNVHVGATLARAVGVSFGQKSASDLLHPDGVAAHPVLTSTDYGWWDGETSALLRGMRADGWSLHWRRDARDADAGGVNPAMALDAGRVRLYDERADRGEMHDVARNERARVMALVAEIARREDALAARRPKAVASGRGTLQLLQATGYAGQAR